MPSPEALIRAGGLGEGRADMANIGNIDALRAQPRPDARPAPQGGPSARPENSAPAAEAARTASAERQPSVAELAAAVDNVNRYLKSVNQALRFDLDKDTGRTVVRVLDAETKEVIRQYPSETMLAVARALTDGKGGLLDDLA